MNKSKWTCLIKSKNYNRKCKNLKCGKQVQWFVLSDWEKVWVAAGKPGDWGTNKSEAVLEKISKYKKLIPALKEMLYIAKLYSSDAYPWSLRATPIRQAEKALEAVTISNLTTKQNEQD